MRPSISFRRQGDKLVARLVWSTPYGDFAGTATVDLNTVKREVTAFLRDHGAVIAGPVNLDTMVTDTAKRRACRGLQDGIGDWEKGPNTLRMQAEVSGLLDAAETGSVDAQNALRALYLRAKGGDRQAVAATRIAHRMRSGEVGFSLRSITSAVKNVARTVKTTSRIIDNPIASAMISQVPGGAALVSANKLARAYTGNIAKVVQAVKQSDPQAVQALAQVARAAADGDKKAQAAIQIVQAVNSQPAATVPTTRTVTVAPPVEEIEPDEVLRATPPGMRSRRPGQNTAPIYSLRGRGPVPDDFDQVPALRYFPAAAYLRGVRA